MFVAIVQKPVLHEQCLQALRRSNNNRSISSRVAPQSSFCVGFNELTTALVALEPLFTIVDATILDRLGRGTNGASRHGRRTAKHSTSPSLHLDHYP